MPEKKAIYRSQAPSSVAEEFAQSQAPQMGIKTSDWQNLVQANRDALNRSVKKMPGHEAMLATRKSPISIQDGLDLAPVNAIDSAGAPIQETAVRRNYMR